MVYTMNQVSSKLQKLQNISNLHQYRVSSVVHTLLYFAGKLSQCMRTSVIVKSWMVVQFFRWRQFITFRCRPYEFIATCKRRHRFFTVFCPWYFINVPLYLRCSFFVCDHAYRDWFIVSVWSNGQTETPNFFANTLHFLFSFFLTFLCLFELADIKMIELLFNISL